MTDETTPARPSLATFLQNPPATTKPVVAPEATPAVVSSDAGAVDAEGGLELPLPAEPETSTPSVPVEAMPVGNVDIDTDADDAAEPASAVAAPNFLRGARATAAPARATPRWQWGLVLALALLLGLQIIIADRARLAADAGTRPLVSTLCSVLRCTLPPWHEPSAFSMLSRDIRPVPGHAGALQVQASFRNDARWAQAWPALRLSLSDADGRVIGRRTLQPADYLGADADPHARLEPGQSAQVSFRLREPAAATVAFSFEFQ